MNDGAGLRETLPAWISSLTIARVLRAAQAVRHESGSNTPVVSVHDVVQRLLAEEEVIAAPGVMPEPPNWPAYRAVRAAVVEVAQQGPGMTYMPAT